MSRTQRVVYAVVVRIRHVLYRLGVRPRLGSIWHSPSLAVMYTGRAFAEAVAHEIEQRLELVERELRRQRP